MRAWRCGGWARVKDGLAHGWQGWLWRRPGDSFSPTGLLQPLGLETGERDHAHEASVQAVSVQAGSVQALP